MVTQVIVLNGGSSSGKTGIAFGQRGEVTPGEGFRVIEAAWMTGVAAMTQAGAGARSPGATG